MQKLEIFVVSSLASAFWFDRFGFLKSFSPPPGKASTSIQTFAPGCIQTGKHRTHVRIPTFRLISPRLTPPSAPPGGEVEASGASGQAQTVRGSLLAAAHSAGTERVNRVDRTFLNLPSPGNRHSNIPPATPETDRVNLRREDVRSSGHY